jgi:hypothetical protein
MGPTLQQQFANAKSAYEDAKARHKPTREFRRRMCSLKARIIAMEAKAERKVRK